MNSLSVLACVIAFPDPAVTNADHLKPLDWAVGVWRLEVTLPAKKPGEKKRKVSREWKFSWTANKNALLVGSRLNINGDTVGQLDALFGWSRASKQILGYGFYTGGGAGGPWSITYAEGAFTINAGESKWIFTRKGKDKLVITDSMGASQEYSRPKE